MTVDMADKNFSSDRESAEFSCSDVVLEGVPQVLGLPSPNLANSGQPPRPPDAKLPSSNLANSGRQPRPQDLVTARERLHVQEVAECLDLASAESSQGDVKLVEDPRVPVLEFPHCLQEGAPRILSLETVIERPLAQKFGESASRGASVYSKGGVPQIVTVEMADEKGSPRSSHAATSC